MLLVRRSTSVLTSRVPRAFGVRAFSKDSPSDEQDADVPKVCVSLSRALLCTGQQLGFVRCTYIIMGEAILLVNNNKRLSFQVPRNMRMSDLIRSGHLLPGSVKARNSLRGIQSCEVGHTTYAHTNVCSFSRGSSPLATCPKLVLRAWALVQQARTRLGQ